MRLGPNPHAAASNEYFMYEALRLAHRGLGWTSPNPPVGCVLVREGEIVGRGWHAEPGGLHAETAALADCEDPGGATAYVTLEPCSHVGRQPACTDELRRAGIARVVYGCDDADLRSGGKAAGALRESGIEVASGVLSQECTDLLLPYLFAKQHNRPHIHLKVAASLDGKIACANGASQWLSGPESLGLAHYLRQQYDAILVGRGTVLADDPRLTVRPEILAAFADPDLIKARDPVRIVLDPGFTLLDQLDRLRISEAGNQRHEWPSLILAGGESELPTADDRNKKRVVLLGLPAAANGTLDLKALHSSLWELGIQSVLVEGGSFALQQYVLQDAADQLTVVLTPRMLGTDALGFTPQLQLTAVAGGPTLNIKRSGMLGSDLVVEAEFNPTIG